MIGYNELQKTIFDFSYGAALGNAIGQKAFEGNKNHCEIMKKPRLSQDNI